MPLESAPPAGTAPAACRCAASRAGLSKAAREGVTDNVDNLYFFVTALTAFFALLVVIRVVVSAIKDRDRTGDRAGTPITGSIPFELGWSLVPFFTSMVIFGWATVVFFERVRAPEQTLESVRPTSDGWGSSSVSTDRDRGCLDNP